MTYAAKEVANYVVSYCFQQGCPISNLKLQKMLYFLWVEYFKQTGDELYMDEICAWRLGPVVPEVYYAFCSYAGTPINLKLPSNIDDSDKVCLDKVIQEYLPMAASTLVDKTHQAGKPWDIVYQDGIGNRKVIPFELIVELECAA